MSTKSAADTNAPSTCQRTIRRKPPRPPVLAPRAPWGRSVTPQLHARAGAAEVAEAAPLPALRAGGPPSRRPAAMTLAEMRRDALECWRAAVDAVNPGRLVAARLCRLDDTLCLG